jgi:hypothetical protein
MLLHDIFLLSPYQHFNVHLGIQTKTQKSSVLRL